jgi:prepilin-type N-terminal cleavage/methylation domain-containing protein
MVKSEQSGFTKSCGGRPIRLTKSGFTLVEMIVVIAIIAILAALLVPTFAAAKREAHHVAWAESARQVGMGINLYQADYDDTYMLARQSFAQDASPQTDRTWVQGVLPYVEEFNLFLCPVDMTRARPAVTFDPDLTGGDSVTRYYEASQRSNLGYNFTYLSPVVDQGKGWTSFPRQGGQIATPSETLMLADSAWEINNGKPSGGGNYLIVPPCRFAAGENKPRDSFGFEGTPNEQFFTGGREWGSGTASGLPGGGLYPWFESNITTVYADGRMARVPIARLTQGCEVRSDWQGLILDSQRYLWDIQ